MVDEVFLEVPFYGSTELGILFVGEEPVDGVHVCSLDGDLGKEREGRLLLFPAEGLDLQVGAGFLSVEVIGRKCENLEASGLVLFLE
jgi:hypothetical protein